VKHDTIMALARLRWPVDDKTWILPVREPFSFIHMQGYEETIWIGLIVKGLWAGYGPVSNTLVIWNAGESPVQKAMGVANQLAEYEDFVHLDWQDISGRTRIHSLTID